MAPGTSLAASSLAKFEPSLLLSTIIKSYLLLWGFKVALPDSHFLHSFIWKRNAIVVVQASRFFRIGLLCINDSRKFTGLHFLSSLLAAIKNMLCGWLVKALGK